MGADTQVFWVLETQINFAAPTKALFKLSWRLVGIDYWPKKRIAKIPHHFFTQFWHIRQVSNGRWVWLGGYRAARLAVFLRPKTQPFAVSKLMMCLAFGKIFAKRHQWFTPLFSTYGWVRPKPIKNQTQSSFMALSDAIGLCEKPWCDVARTWFNHVQYEDHLRRVFSF